MKKFLIILLAFFFILPSKTFADEGWLINSFTSDISIQKDGTVRVKESIDVDFRGLSKHGIYRDIPYKYTDASGNKTYTKISDVSTGNDKKKLEKEGDFVRIRIGDPDKTISGTKHYTIEYTVVGVLRGFDQYDELYWNVTGNNWPVPILLTTATVRLPNTKVTQYRCYQGSMGSREECFRSMAEGSSALFSSHGLQESEGLTVVVGYPKNVIALPVVKSLGERLLSFSSLVTLLITMGLGVGAIIWHWYRNGRDYIFSNQNVYEKNKKEQTAPFGHRHVVVVEFTPPQGLRPAEIGVIADEKADTLDVTATIIDLAARGFLTITEEKKKWVFGSVDYTLHKKNKETAKLNPYEKKLFDELFATGEIIKISSLKKTFYDELTAVKNQLYQDVVTKGFFPKNPESVRNTYLGIGIVLVVLVGFLMTVAISSDSEYLIMIVIGLIVSCVNLIFVSRIMPRRSAKGNEMYRRIQGYQLFISNVEKYRQQFFERKNMFNEVLPYAIVFGLTAKFAKDLEKIGYTPENLGWYHGVGVFSATRFESQVSSFSNSLSSAMVSTPSGSGGFSGGGSSGGGFGGGGGGSW